MSRKKVETGFDRLKAMPLWQWGAICVFAGMMASVVTGFQPVPTDAAAARGQALGRGVATGVFVLVGMGLMLFDVLRKKPPVERHSKRHKHESR